MMLHEIDVSTKNSDCSLQTRILDALFNNAQNFNKQNSWDALYKCVNMCGKNIDIHAQEPWPQKIQLFQPYEVEQILLPDNANCLAVQAYLKMCNLEFQIEPRSNAEYMSPSGRVPFIKCGAFTITEFDNIVNFISCKGESLSKSLESTDKADMRAYISCVNNVLVNAEQYICWVDPATLNSVTKSRYGSVYPFPLNHILTWQKKTQVVKKLKVLGWYNKSLSDVFNEVKICCNVLSDRLDNKAFFFGDKPTELDAIIYGHIKALFLARTLPPVMEIINIVHQFPHLLDHACRIDNLYFQQENDLNIESFAIIQAESKDSLWNFSEPSESLFSLEKDYLA